MQYKIFITNVSGATDQHLIDRGLEDLVRDSGADWEKIPAGRGPDPDRSGGMVASWRTGNTQVDAPDGIPEHFEWVASPPCGDRPKGAYWVGINPEAKPGPLELKRKKQLPGVLVELADLRKWSVPIARGVPYSIGVDYDNGQATAVIDDRFRKYSERTFRHAMLLAEREEQLASLKNVFFGIRLTDDELRQLYFNNRVRYAELSTLEEMDRELAIAILFDESLEHAVDGLSINYRLNRFLILHLQLLEVSTEKNHLRDICLAAMEAHEIAETLKKTANGRLISLLAG